MTVVPTENIPTPMLFYVLPISILGLVLYNKFFRRIDSSLYEYCQLTSYEYCQLTSCLEYDKRNNLTDYFDKNEVSISERINFLKSSHGLAFLSIYRKSNNIDYLVISQIILESKAKEQIISSAVEKIKTK